MEYKHVISLGHACAVAHEIERLGYREHSGPFDWQASRSLEVHIKLISEHFDTFFDDLKPEKLWQRKVAYTYLMKSCGLFLVHDFNEYYPVKDQLPDVIRKYERRVKNFYSDIKEPTLFIYYLYDQDDANWIDNNAEHVIQTLKGYNPQNEIIYVADRSIQLKQACYYVENDAGSDIAWDFVNRNAELAAFLKNLPYPVELRKKNLAFFENSSKNKRMWINRMRKAMHRYYMKFTHKVYRHNLVSIED